MPRLQQGILGVAALALGAALVVLYGIGPVQASPPPSLAGLVADAAPKPLKDASFTDAAGRPRSLASFKGRLTILNLWATWCAPCVAELPALARLEKAVGPGRLAVVAVNEGRDNAADTAAFLKAHAAGNLAVYRDSDLALLGVFGTQGLPFSVVIDARGREIARASGPLKWDDADAIAYFQTLAAHAAR